MNLPVFFSVFFTIFLAELGDKTQLAVLAQSANAPSRWTVFFAATLALSLSTALAVFAGAAFHRHVSPRALKLAGGVLFVVFGLFMLRGAFVGEAPEPVENTAEEARG